MQYYFYIQGATCIEQRAILKPWYVPVYIVIATTRQDYQPCGSLVKVTTFLCMKLFINWF